MKDEEMAEEYARKTLSKDCCDLKLVAYKRTINSFLAGLKAGRPQWHKVADEGLPINKNDGTTYLLYTIYGEGGSPVVAHFAYRDKQQLMNVWTGAILTEDKIIAWCEIPTFDKE